MLNLFTVFCYCFFAVSNVVWSHFRYVLSLEWICRNGIIGLNDMYLCRFNRYYQNVLCRGCANLYLHQQSLCLFLLPSLTRCAFRQYILANTREKYYIIVTLIYMSILGEFEHIFINSKSCNISKLVSLLRWL